MRYFLAKKGTNLRKNKLNDALVLIFSCAI